MGLDNVLHMRKEVCKVTYMVQIDHRDILSLFAVITQPGIRFVATVKLVLLAHVFDDEAFTNLFSPSSAA